MEFADLPTVAYLEGADTGQALSSKDEVRSARLSYDLARATALSPEASFSFIESVLKEYTP